MRQALLAAAAATIIGAGCGSGSAVTRDTPPATARVESVIAMLESDDPGRYYELLSADVKRRLSYEEFALQWRRTRPERERRASALREGLKANPDLGERAKVVFADGKAVYLRREGGAWRLESALIARTHAGHPHDAVQIFAEGLGKRDYDAVLRVLTTRRRDGIGKQVDAFATSLARHLQSKDNAIEITGDRAELRWDEGGMRYRIVLLKEGEEWRVDDVHIRPAPEQPEGEEPASDEEEDGDES